MPIITREAFIYTVQQGDTLYSIAQRFRSSVEGITRANHVSPPVTDPGLIYPGDVLVVPTQSGSGIVSYIIKPKDTMGGIAHRFNSYVDLVAGVNTIENPNVIYPGQTLKVPAFIYEIESGDTLYRISQKFGVSLFDISIANEDRVGFQQDVIWPGYQLVVPLVTSRNIVVWQPLPGTRIGSGQRISGQARAFEANVLHQVRDANGVIVSRENYTTADIGAPSYGNFMSTLQFENTPTAGNGELWVYTRSAKDGSIQDLVKTVVRF